MRPASGVDEERMAQEYVTGLAGRLLNGSRGIGKGDPGSLTSVGTGQAIPAGGIEEPRHIQVTAGQDPGRGVGRSDIGEQAEHEQSALLGSVVHEPAGVAMGLEAGVDVPARVAGIGLTREPDHEGSEVGPPLPPVGVEQLADRLDQRRRVRRGPERLALD